jgi:hypothetical protein
LSAIAFDGALDGELLVARHLMAGAPAAFPICSSASTARP